MKPNPGQDLPVLDDGVLRELKDDVGDAAAQAFMAEYLLTLVARAVRIFNAFALADAAQCFDAVLSLQTSSQMAGAVRLSAYCRSLERALKNGQCPDANAVKGALSAHIRAVIREASRRGHLPLKKQYPGT